MASSKLGMALLVGIVLLQAFSSLPGLLFAAPAGAASQTATNHGLTSHAFQGLEQLTPAASHYAPRVRPARRVMTVNQQMEKMEEEPSRHWLWLLVLSCLWPMLCVTFLSDAKALNMALQNFPSWVGVTVYLTLSNFFWLLFRTGLFNKSAKAVVQVACNTLKRFGLTPWRLEVLKKTAQPLANATQGCLAFLAFNCLMTAVPATAVFQLPQFLSFLDVNKTGVLEAAAMEQWAFGLASRLLVAWVALQGALFVDAAKEPPTCEIEQPKSLIAQFLAGLQRLQGVADRSGQKDMEYALTTEALVVQCVDKGLSVAAWGFAVGMWANLAGMTLKSVLAIGGMSGIAIGLAASNTVSNLMSGLLIFFHRTILVGDEIRNGNGSINGFVDQIRATNTVIYKASGEPLIVPNSMLLNDTIVNVQRREFWAIEQTYPLSLKDYSKVDEVIAALQETLEKEVAPHQHSAFPGRHHMYHDPACWLEDFNGGATVKIRAFVDGDLERHEFYKVQSQILLALSEKLHSLDGAKFKHEGGWGGPPQNILKN